MVVIVNVHLHIDVANRRRRLRYVGFGGLRPTQAHLRQSLEDRIDQTLAAAAAPDAAAAFAAVIVVVALLARDFARLARGVLRILRVETAGIGDAAGLHGGVLAEECGWI